MKNTDLFGKAYTKIKNEYLMPLVSTEVPIDKSEFWTMKYRLLKCPGYPEDIGRNFFSIRMGKEDFFKIIISEINLFQTKVVKQEKNTQFGVSNNWKFVTNYYLFYISAIQFLLFQHKGLTYLPPEISNTLISLFSSYGKNPDGYDIANGDYYFDEELISSDEVVIKFMKETSTGGSHAHLWKRMDSIIANLIQYSDSNEKLVYNQIRLLNNDSMMFKTNYPSDTRNHFNYSPESGLNDFYNNQKINFINNIDKRFLTRFIELNPSKNDDYYKKSMYTQYYGIIISSLKEALYREYISRGHEKDAFYLKNKKNIEMVINNTKKDD